MSPGHEQAWADALAQEHLHQRELLATLRDELGTFARECAAALSALDAVVGVAGVAEAIGAAQKAKLAVDVGRRLRGGDDPQLVDLYEAVAGHEDVPPALVRHASDVLASGPKRSDRELLQAVVNASGARAQIEQLVGPAPWAALAALQPLVRWIRAGDRRPGDVAQVLAATAQLGGGSAASVAADASAVGRSLRDAVEHVEGAAKSVRDGKLAQVLAEARETLQKDLDALRSIHESATDAPAEWRDARVAEHAELAEEVRVKLERVERIRATLFRLLPQLQAITRAIGAVQRLHALEQRLDPAPAAGVVAAQAALELDATDVWAAALSEPGPRGRRFSKRARWAAVAVVVLAAAGIGIALASGGSKAKPVVIETTAAAPPTTTTAAVPAVGAKPRLLPVRAVFDQSARATVYTISIEQGGEQVTAYRWTLTTPPGNPTCNKFGPVPGKPNEAVWHHADTDGCTHNGIQHDGTVHVRVLTLHWSCTESFFGTLTRTGSPDAQCARR